MPCRELLFAGGNNTYPMSWRYKLLFFSFLKHSTDVIFLFYNFLNISFWSTEILKSSPQEHTVTPREVWKRVIAPTVKADTITLTRAKRKNKSSSDFFVLTLLFSILLLVIRTKLLGKISILLALWHLLPSASAVTSAMRGTTVQLHLVPRHPLMTV